MSTSTIYRWMEEYLVQWILTASGQRRIYEDSLLRHHGRRRRLGEPSNTSIEANG